MNTVDLRYYTLRFPDVTLRFPVVAFGVTVDWLAAVGDLLRCVIVDYVYADLYPTNGYVVAGYVRCYGGNWLLLLQFVWNRARCLTATCPGYYAPICCYVVALFTTIC